MGLVISRRTGYTRGDWRAGGALVVLWLVAQAGASMLFLQDLAWVYLLLMSAISVALVFGISMIMRNRDIARLQELDKLLER